MIETPLEFSHICPEPGNDDCQGKPQGRKAEPALRRDAGLMHLREKNLSEGARSDLPLAHVPPDA